MSIETLIDSVDEVVTGGVTRCAGEGISCIACMPQHFVKVIAASGSVRA